PQPLATDQMVLPSKPYPDEVERTEFARRRRSTRTLQRHRYLRLRMSACYDSADRGRKAERLVRTVRFVSSGDGNTKLDVATRSRPVIVPPAYLVNSCGGRTR